MMVHEQGRYIELLCMCQHIPSSGGLPPKLAKEARDAGIISDNDAWQKFMSVDSTMKEKLVTMLLAHRGSGRCRG